MPYTLPWDETLPLDSSAANLIGQDIRDLKVELRERLNDIFGITDWATQAQPMKGSKLNLARNVLSYIVPGSTSLSIRDSTDSVDNLLINENGSVVVRGILSAGLGLIVSAGGAIITAGGLSITAGGLAVVAGLTATQALDVAGQARTIAVNYGNATGAKTVDWNLGNLQYATLTGNTTFTFSNPAEGSIYTLILIQGGVGSFTVTWPTIKWAGGSAPTLTTTVGKADIVSLIYTGGSYYGMLAGGNY